MKETGKTICIMDMENYNGQLKYEGYFKKDMKHGQGTLYYNGKIIYKSKWSNDINELMI